jgi:hypothetical protein
VTHKKSETYLPTSKTYSEIQNFLVCHSVIKYLQLHACCSGKTALSSLKYAAFGLSLRSTHKRTNYVESFCVPTVREYLSCRLQQTDLKISALATDNSSLVYYSFTHFNANLQQTAICLPTAATCQVPNTQHTTIISLG